MIDKEKMKKACEIDNKEQRAGDYHNENMNTSHKMYSEAINENELLKKLMKKYRS